MRKVAVLIQDVVGLETQGESTDVLRDRGVPVPFRKTVSFRISGIEVIVELGSEFKLVLRDIAAAESRSI